MTDEELKLIAHHTTATSNATNPFPSPDITEKKVSGRAMVRTWSIKLAHDM